MELEEDMYGVGSVPGAVCARVRVTEETCLVCVYNYKAVVDFVEHPQAGLSSLLFCTCPDFRACIKK